MKTKSLLVLWKNQYLVTIREIPYYTKYTTTEILRQYAKQYDFDYDLLTGYWLHPDGIRILFDDLDLE